MTQAAMKIQTIPTLAALLEREFEPERLAATLGFDASLPAQLWQQALSGPVEAMASRPGKELRGRLVELAWQLCGGRGELPAELPAIVEALHLGSLIVDDIEDNSLRRRGGPALHQLVGLPIALNAGNWLYFVPSLLVSRLGLPRQAELALRRTVDQMVLRCHYGQALDLSARVTELRQRDVPAVVLATTRLKTGALTELATRLGALAASADDARVDALGAFGRDFGVALQMLDDLTGLVEEKRCHKGHEDLLESRPTWPWAWLAERADNVAYCRLRALAENVARRDLHPEVLAEQLRDSIAASGFAAIRAHLDGARQALRDVVGEPPAFGAVNEAIVHLERYDG